MPHWTQTQAKAAVTKLAKEVAEAFNVPMPQVAKYGAGRDWEYRFPGVGESIEVWTDCGCAELSVNVSATFAHLYFRFEDVERAKAHPMINPADLNPFSGKWNDWCGSSVEKDTSGEMLQRWARDVAGNFYRVNDPNPDPEEVEARRNHKAEELKKWQESLGFEQ